MKINKTNFIQKIIDKDIRKKKYKDIKTRFAPEPNGYLHLGHAKSIFLNFEIAKIYKGKCNLRFDDTNPEKEKKKYICSIKKDLKWLGYKWNKKVKYASNYFKKLYKYAKKLIKKKKAYVDQLNKYEIKKYRGTLKKKGINSPYRNQNIKKNLKLFKKMKKGKIKEGTACLRALINMKDSRIIMRDPVLYRIKLHKHHRTKKKWNIYPTYDFTHCISDSIEKITHSLCTLEFLDNKSIYNWILKNSNIKFKPKQYEFSRLNLENTVLSKRKLKILINKKIVNGWDDPRMPTISGLKNRGYTAKSIKNFCKNIGITKQNNLIQLSFLEHCIKKELNKTAPRFTAILNPLKLIIVNYPKNLIEEIEVPNHPQNKNFGKRIIYFTNEIYIDKLDFQKLPKNKKLYLNRKIRLRYSYIIKCIKIKKNKKGKIKKIYCKYYENKFNKTSKKKKKLAIIHWISKNNKKKAQFNLFKPIFFIKNPENKKNFLEYINKDSLKIKIGFIENAVLKCKNKKNLQFEREGYFFLKKNPKKKTLIFNQTINLRKKI